MSVQKPRTFSKSAERRCPKCGVEEGSLHTPGCPLLEATLQDITPPPTGQVRTFGTGATRDSDEGKYDYEGFLSELVLERFAEYMHKHRKQSDGTLRASDNWQRGIPREQYMKSAWRHFMEWWTIHRKRVRGRDLSEPQIKALDEALCAMMFNVMGYLHEEMVEKWGLR